MHIYAKIVCAHVNRFIKIISQGKSLLIRETLQWKYIYAKIVCAIHQNYLSLKNLLILQTLHQHSMEGLMQLLCILLLKKSGSKIKTTLCRRTLVKGHYFVNVELSKQKGCVFQSISNSRHFLSLRVNFVGGVRDPLMRKPLNNSVKGWILL